MAVNNSLAKDTLKTIVDIQNKLTSRPEEADIVEEMQKTIEESWDEYTVKKLEHLLR